MIRHFHAADKLGLVLALGACDVEPAPSLQPAAELVAADRWVPSLLDPLPSHQPPAIECPPDGISVEPDGLEIDTGICRYLLVEQPMLAELRAGDTVELALLHQTLTAPAPATAHIALAVDGQLLWETQVAIPAPAQLLQARVDIDRDVEAGAPVVLHLHNHGLNNYTLLAIERAARSQP